MFNYKQAIELLNQHGQGHLLAFYDELDDARRGQLLEQIEGLDFSQIPGWITDYVKNSFPMAVPDHFDPAPAYPPQPASPDEERKYAQARRLGVELISAGKVAAFIVAGGQ